MQRRDQVNELSEPLCKTTYQEPNFEHLWEKNRPKIHSWKKRGDFAAIFYHQKYATQFYLVDFFAEMSMAWRNKSPMAGRGTEQSSAGMLMKKDFFFCE